MLAKGLQSAYQVPGPSVPSKRSTKEMSSMKSGLAALYAACVCAAVAFSAAPASAQSRLQTCNDEWNAMKANNTVGDKKYADFRKECLAKTAAAPAEAPAATTSPTPAAPPGAARPPPQRPHPGRPPQPPLGPPRLRSPRPPPSRRPRPPPESRYSP